MRDHKGLNEIASIIRKDSVALVNKLEIKKDYWFSNFNSLLHIKQT